MRETTPKINSGTRFATTGKKKNAYHFSFSRKNAIIRNIEIIVACIVAFIVGTGVYDMFQ